MSFWTKIVSIFSNSGQPDCETSKPKLLIVDDANENRMILEIMTKKAGFDFVCCSNGEEAIKLANEEDFDAVLMDIYMPGIDGLEATTRIKAHGKNQQTPIIAVTAADSDEEKCKRIEAGVDDYVAKPVNADNLIKRVNKNIAQANQIKTAQAGGAILSTMSSDPTYKKAIKIFVNSLPERLKNMREAFEGSDIETLARIVHSLKGTGGMAGFPVYTVKAKQLEVIVKSENPDMEIIKEKIAELEMFCKNTKKTCR